MPAVDLRSRLIGDFELQYVTKEEVIDRDKDGNPKPQKTPRYQLQFACGLLLGAGERHIEYSAEEASILGALWKSKVPITRFDSDFRRFLQPNKLYRVRAAIEVYAMSGGSEGLWFEIIRFLAMKHEGRWVSLSSSSNKLEDTQEEAA